MVTPDGERTMNTYLGAAQDLQPSDIDEAAVAAAAVIYLEGYLWDPPKAKEAFVKAAEIAHRNNRKVALTLSDSFCVGRYRGEFLDLIRKGTVDIVFANESELKSLYETADFDTAVKALRGDAKLAVVTRSEKGCVVITRDGVEAVQAMPIDKRGRCHRRRRSVRRRLPGRPFARQGSSHLGASRRPGGGGSDPAYRRAAGGVAQGARCREWSRAVSPAGFHKDLVTNW